MLIYGALLELFFFWKYFPVHSEIRWLWKPLDCENHLVVNSRTNWLVLQILYTHTSLSLHYLYIHKRYSSAERSKFPVLFTSSCSPKLALSITTDQLAYYGLIAVKSAILEEREPDKETNNFGRSSLGGAAENWMMECDGRLEVYNKCIKNVCILCLKLLMSSCLFSAVCQFLVVGILDK